MVNITNHHEILIKSTMRYHPIPITMGFIKKTRDNSVGEDVEKRVHLYTLDRNVNPFSHYGKQYGEYSKY